jgi:hypothetical protein
MDFGYVWILGVWILGVWILGVWILGLWIWGVTQNIFFANDNASLSFSPLFD